MNFSGEEGRDRARPVRQCALERTRSREDELLRFVLDPDGRVVPDIKRKLPGRGVWITAAHEAVARSVRQKVFAKAFRRAVAVDPDLADSVADLLRRAALQDLALANKAGCVVAGFTKVDKALRSAKPVVLVHASDASRDGSRKLDRIGPVRREDDEDGAGPVTCFASAELTSALGKENVIHAAVADDGAGRKFLWSAKRYISYLGTRLAAAAVADMPAQDQE